MTAYEYTIGRSDGADFDYATIASAVSDITNQASGTDWVSQGDTVVWVVHRSTVSSESAAEKLIYEGTPNISGVVTTGASNYLTIRPDAADHWDGTRLSGIRLKPATTGTAVTITMHHAHLDGFEIRAGTANSDECVRIASFGSGALGTDIGNCLMEPYLTSAQDCDGVYVGNYETGSATYPTKVHDCVGYGFHRAVIHSQQYGASANASHYWDIVNVEFVESDFGIGWQQKDGGEEIVFHIHNCVGGNNTSADFGWTASSSGSLVYTDSSDNFGESTGTVGSATDGAFPDNTTITFTDSTAGGGFDCIVEDYTGSFPDWDFRLVDHANNDVLDIGIGPASEALVEDEDCVGTLRTGTTTDPGHYQVTTYAAATRRVFVIS